MCLMLSHAEAMLWKQKANDLISDAIAANIPPDPLLQSAPKLSEVVSAVEGIKKRHGLLIEEALIAAINLVSGWTASKGVIPRPNKGVFRADCVAYSATTQTAYLFECKRRYASFDGDKRRAINSKLDEITKQFHAFTVSQGWTVIKTGIFILSFYGGGPANKYQIHDRRSVASLFPPCAVRFVEDFIGYSETVVGRWCSERLDPHPLTVENADRHQPEQDADKHQADLNLFELLEREKFAETDRFEVGAHGVRVVRTTDRT